MTCGIPISEGIEVGECIVAEGWQRGKGISPEDVAPKDAGRIRIGL